MVGNRANSLLIGQGEVGDGIELTRRDGAGGFAFHMGGKQQGVVTIQKRLCSGCGAQCYRRAAAGAQHDARTIGCTGYGQCTGYISGGRSGKRGRYRLGRRRSGRGEGTAGELDLSLIHI